MNSTETLSLASDIKPLCSLSLHVRRVSESVVGRPLELAAVEQAVRSAHTSFTGLTLEGEPGIGKTRLLLAASEIAAADGFVTIGVMADEQIRECEGDRRQRVEEGDLADAPDAEPPRVVEDHEHREKVDERDQEGASEVQREGHAVLELRADLRADEPAPDEDRVNHPARPASSRRSAA